MVRTPTDQSVTVSELIANLPIGAEATTSRVVVDTPAIRVVMFAMDAGQELTDHSSPRA
jgi:quercetin dioxygenase-like cupin family protein